MSTEFYSWWKSSWFNAVRWLGIKRNCSFSLVYAFFLQQSNKNRKENPVKISRTMYQPRARYLIWTVHICVRSENRKFKLHWEMILALKKKTHLKTQKEYSFKYILYLKHVESFNYTHQHMHTPTHTHQHIQTHTHTHQHTHTHTHIYIYIYYLRSPKFTLKHLKC